MAGQPKLQLRLHLLSAPPRRQTRPIWLQTFWPVCVGALVVICCVLALAWQAHRQAQANVRLQRQDPEPAKTWRETAQQLVQSLATDLRVLNSNQAAIAASQAQIGAGLAEIGNTSDETRRFGFHPGERHPGLGGSADRVDARDNQPGGIPPPILPGGTRRSRRPKPRRHREIGFHPGQGHPGPGGSTDRVGARDHQPGGIPPPNLPAGTRRAPPAKAAPTQRSFRRKLQKWPPATRPCWIACQGRPTRRTSPLRCRGSARRLSAIRSCSPSTTASFSTAHVSNRTRNPVCRRSPRRWLRFPLHCELKSSAARTMIAPSRVGPHDSRNHWRWVGQPRWWTISSSLGSLRRTRLAALSGGATNRPFPSDTVQNRAKNRTAVLRLSTVFE